MIHRLYILVLLLSSYQLSSQEVWPDKTRVLPEALRKIPIALYIQHSPNPNYPEPNDTGDNPDQKYVWKHATTVCSPTQELTVIKAGSFIWYDTTGWKENVQYSKKGFKKRFECDKGILQAGECYTFQKNYRWGSNPYGGDALWYVLAKDEKGTIYKGIGLIETESEIINNSK